MQKIQAQNEFTVPIELIEYFEYAWAGVKLLYMAVRLALWWLILGIGFMLLSPVLVILLPLWALGKLWQK